MNRHPAPLQLKFLLAFVLAAVSLRAQVLPPLTNSPAANNPLPSAASLFVREFHFEGNHAFTDAQLSEVTKPFTNRKLSTGDLEQARRNVSLYYVSHGYVNSGAVIPDQDPTNGVVTLRIVEGRLTTVQLEKNKWLRDSYITNRVERWASAPLNLTHLQEGLQLLRENPNVQQINAELKPGTAPGESVLDLKVTDRQPFRAGLQFDNDRPPSVGDYELWALLSDLNLTGNSDPLNFKYGIMNASHGGPEFSGDDNMEGDYTLPLTRFDTTLNFRASRLNTGIIEVPFNALDITSLTSDYGASLRQPIYQTANREFALSLGFDWRQNKSWIGGIPFTVSPGAINGEMTASVLSLSQEWLSRGQNHVLALRSTFNVGLDVLGATYKGSGDPVVVGTTTNRAPDARFFSWVGQGQYIQRLFNTQNQLILRVSGQWADSSLLALQQLSVGGPDSVRGYLVNQLVRDRGIISSAEFRIPLLFNKAGAGIVQLAPFFDYGGAWDVNGSPNPTSIYSAGSGLLFSPNKYVSGEIYWGYRIQHVHIPGGSGVQGAGVTFQLNFNAF